MDAFKKSFCLHFLGMAVFSIGATPTTNFNQGLTEFANEFYSHCVEEKPGNVIVSPLSVFNALSLLAQGATGESYEQLQRALHFGDDKFATANQFLVHLETLEKNAGESTFTIANGIFVQEGRQLNKDFQNVASAKFKSSIETLNFSESAKSADAINHFVEEKTNGKIKDLVKADQFDSDSRTVLVNAILFKGRWEKPFYKEYTSKGDFYNSETGKVSVDFMYMNNKFDWAYIRDLEATALEMKYANSSMSLVIVLPESRTGLSALESKLKHYGLAKITENLETARFDVYIPKFKVEYEIKLNDVLKKMGMTEMFSDSAHLMGLLDSGEQLKVSDVVHKATIEVDENGSEASAGTGVIGVLGSIPQEFRADHPFLYLIRETETNTILFSGHIERFS